jgi:ABC-type sugar transport system ATPase subunit
VGAGRTEVARAIFGADPAEAGTVEVFGREVRIRRPGDALKERIAMVPESRKDDGLVLGRSVTENMTLPHLRHLSRMGLVDRGRERDAVARLTTDVDLRAKGENVSVGSLSGGNQQKVLLARWLYRDPRILIADEPTRGVDVGAKLAIHEILHGLAEAGMAVLLISSELEEVIGLAHRVLVMREGRVAGIFEGNIDQAEVMHAALA